MKAGRVGHHISDTIRRTLPYLRE